MLSHSFKSYSNSHRCTCQLKHKQKVKINTEILVRFLCLHFVPSNPGISESTKRFVSFTAVYRFCFLITVRYQSLHPVSQLYAFRMLVLACLLLVLLLFLLLLSVSSLSLWLPFSQGASHRRRKTKIIQPANNPAPMRQTVLSIHPNSELPKQLQ